MKLLRSISKFNDLSILIFSADNYSDVWYPTFSLLNKYWPNHPKTYLATEYKTCKYADFTLNYPNQDVNVWTRRMQNAVSKIPTEFVIFMDCDYWLRSPVDENEIFECIQRMKKDKKIAVFNFERVTDTADSPCQWPRYLKRQPYSWAMNSGQASLWRKEALLESFNIPDTDPWNWESYCERGENATDFFGKWDFYRNCSDVPVFNYQHQGAIHKSRWLLDEIVYLNIYHPDIYKNCNFLLRGITVENRNLNDCIKLIQMMDTSIVKSELEF